MFKTKQEEFWNGEFGDDYVGRNSSIELEAIDVGIWSRIIGRTNGIKSVIEFGSNIGLNLRAIRTLLPNVSCSAVEINHKAAEILKNDKFFTQYGRGGVSVCEQSILEFEPKELFDLSFTKGVLIHINPEELNSVYEKLYKSSKKYICMAEYYNPAPVTISYRGNNDRLFKRDFAGEFMDKYPDMKLLDYGFIYHRDYNFPGDDITWFLMEKQEYNYGNQNL